MTFAITEGKAKFRHHNYKLLIEIIESEQGDVLSHPDTGRCSPSTGHLSMTQGSALP